MINEISFRCKVGQMGKRGKIIWIPLKFGKFFDAETFIEVKIRKLR